MSSTKGQDPKDPTSEQDSETPTTPTEQDSETTTPQDDGKAAAELKRARSEAASYRTKLGLLKKSLMEAFGIDDPANVDGKALAQEVRDLRSDLKASKLQATFSSIAASLDADPRLTLALLRSEGSLKDVDPTDSAAITTLVKQALKDNPRLKVTPAAKVGADQNADPKPSASQSINALIRRKAGR